MTGLSAKGGRDGEILPPIHILADHIPWFGQHSGYEQILRYLPGAGVDLRVTQSRTTLNQIRLGRWVRRWQDRPGHNPVYAAAELRFGLKTGLRRAKSRHVLYFEHHHPLLLPRRPALDARGLAIRRPGSTARSKLIGTLHHPPAQWGQWPSELPGAIRRLSAAIVLYRADLPAFEALVGSGRVRFIHHGVDTAFFRPASDPTAVDPRRILFAGQNGRDFDMLRRLTVRLALAHPDLRFDLVVRPTIRERYADLRALADHPAVAWHAGLADLELAALYRRSYLMLLPLTVAGAVNALVEALASGLPVVTSPVGGVPDYGGGTVFPIAERDEDALLALVEAYLARPELRWQVAAGGRAFAEAALAWPKVAAAHAAVYREYLELGYVPPDDCE